MTEAQWFALAGFAFILAGLGYMAWAVWQAIDCVQTGEIFHAKAFAASAVLAFALTLITVWTVTNP